MFLNDIDMFCIYIFYGICIVYDGDIFFFILFVLNVLKILGEEEFNFEGRGYRLVFIIFFYNYIIVIW